MNVKRQKRTEQLIYSFLTNVELSVERFSSNSPRSVAAYLNSHVAKIELLENYYANFDNSTFVEKVKWEVKRVVIFQSIARQGDG